MRLLTGFVLLALYGTSAFCQLKVVTLLRGTVLDQQAGTPVGTEFEVRDLTGRIIQQGRSDARTGTFELILQPGQRYTITFRGYNVLRQTDTIDVPPSKEYTELPQTFRVRLLRQGMELLRLHAFEPGQSVLRPSVYPQLDELKQLLNRNRSLRISVHVAILDTRMLDEPAAASQQSRKKAGRSRGTSLQPVAPPTLLERAQALLNARAEAIRQYLTKGVRDAEERIRIVPEIPPLPIARPLLEAPTVTVFVDQVRELLD